MAVNGCHHSVTVMAAIGAAVALTDIGGARPCKA